MKDLAATYSRASYTGTTIGNAVFDGRVRDGIGSDHSFMVTKKSFKELPEPPARSLKTAHIIGVIHSLRNRLDAFKKKAIKPHDRLVLVR